MRYIYQRDGAPLIRWQGRNSAPMQTRAADTVALGSLGDPTLVLPVPGGVEPLNGLQIKGGGGHYAEMSGISCKCGGSCGCSGGGALHGITDTITGNPVLAVGAAYLAYRLFFKKKRR